MWNFAEADSDDERLVAELGQGNDISGGASDPKAISFAGHQAQLEDLIAAIKENRQPAIDGAEGRKSVEIILAIYHSSNSGTRVSLPLNQDPPLGSAAGQN